MSYLSKFSTKELLYIAILAALGLAIKPIVTPLVHLISVPLMIPGGSLSGGFYMMWLVLASIIVKRFGAAFLVGFIQAIVVLSLGYFGSHGAVSLISYTLPGVAVEIVALIIRKKESYGYCIISCVAANLTGATVVIFLVMRLSVIPMIISLVAASISGIIGGMLSFAILKKLIKQGVLDS